MIKVLLLFMTSIVLLNAGFEAIAFENVNISPVWRKIRSILHNQPNGCKNALKESAQGDAQMNRFPMLACCVVLLTSICGCATQSPPGGHAEGERMVSGLEAEFSKALVAKDLAGLISLYADDAALYDDRNPSIRGKAAIEEAWKTDFARPGLAMITRPRTVEVSGSGEMAWAHGMFAITTKNAGGKPVIDSWEYALVYMKQPDGRWGIMADSVHSGLRSHLLHRLPKSSSPYAPLAPLIGLACFAGGIWFLFGMPVVCIVYAWRFYRNRKLSTGFLVSAVMLLVFFLAGALLWWDISAHYWNLPFMNALAAARDTARYGNPVEDTAESVLVTLIVVSTLSAAVAGVLTGILRWIWTRWTRGRTTINQ
jgi:ketosteroid isomerase-like protein